MAHGNEINNKRFYWLKMDRHFFNDARLKKMRKLPKGDSCVIIYLKLLLLSVEFGGVLVYEHIEDTFEKEMALKLEEKEAPTETTIQYLKQQGMLIPVEGKDDEFFLIQAQNSIGSETKSNVYKRLKRGEKEWLEKFQPSSNQIPIDKEIDIEIDRDIDEESKKENINKNLPSSAGAHDGETLESYDDLMTRWEIGPQLRAALGQFIQHCSLNGRTITNAKLEDIIDRLFDWYGYPGNDVKIDKEQSKEVYRAIQGGWFDIKVRKR